MSMGSELDRQQFDSAIDRCAAWVLRRWEEPLVAYSDQAAPNGMATTFAICALEALDQLGSLSPEKQRAVAEALLDQQSPADGLFRFGSFHRAELLGRDRGHSATYMQLQGTYFALQALDALRVTPRHRIDLAQQLVDPQFVRGWLSGGMWFNPWLQSNFVMFALALLELEQRVYGNRRALPAMHSVLDFLDQRQDATSGLWQPDDGTNMENAVFAAYHFFPFYFWLGRRPAYCERIVDSVLSVQGAHGGFGAQASGGACEDLDAVHTLAYLGLVTDYRNADIRRAVSRCAKGILQLQNSDGGFPNYPAPPVHKSRKRRLAESLRLDKLLGRPAYVRQSHYSGWKTLVVNRGQSDMWGAWFRPLTLRLAYEICGIDLGQRGRGFRRLPGLGWHDRKKIVESASLRREMSDAS
jgi:prenyltransferase beta subunit